MSHSHVQLCLSIIQPDSAGLHSLRLNVMEIS